MAPPVISVLVTCHNLGAYLHEAVDSVLAQSVDDVEILVVDDGSTDPDTLRVLDGLARPKTTLFRTPNRGLARARNFLIERACGEFLCALDADDRLLPGYFEKALGRFADDPSLTFVSAWVQEFGESNRLWRQDRCDLAALLAEDTVMTAALVRRRAVAEIGGYDEEMPAQGDEDWDLWLSLVAAGHRGAIIPEALFHYRRRKGSMSEQCTDGRTHLALFDYLREKHRTAFERHAREVLMLQEARISALLRRTDALEIYMGSQLGPEVARRRAELEILRHRLADSGEESRPGPAAQGPMPSEADELRASWSWRITAPLRSIYEWLLVRRPGRSA